MLMKIIYIAAQFPVNNDFVKVNSKVMPQYAADHVSRLFFEGIKSQLGLEIEAANLLPIASWPFGSRCIRIPRIDWIENESKIEGIPYCNVIGIRQYSKFYNLRKRFMEQAKKWNDENVCVVAYGLSTPILKLFKYLKSIAPNVKTCLIVPDLPQYMNMDGSKLYHFVKKIDIEEQKKLYQYSDGMVYFSEHMNEFFDFQQGKWMVVEGAVKYKESDARPNGRKDCESKKVILYSGAVEVAYGIDDLLQAFMRIEGNDYQLLIIGGGGGVPVVQEALMKDERIKYMGVMEREKVLEYQKNATLLVNPRRAEGAFTRYSFPSKTLEYMVSGTPVLMHKLEGIPAEYDQYLTYFISNEVNQMAKQMKNICEKTSKWRMEKGKAAQEFVLREKNYKRQMEKMCNFIKTL